MLCRGAYAIISPELLVPCLTTSARFARCRGQPIRLPRILWDKVDGTYRTTATSPMFSMLEEATAGKAALVALPGIETGLEIENLPTQTSDAFWLLL